MFADIKRGCGKCPFTYSCNSINNRLMKVLIVNIVFVCLLSGQLFSQALFTFQGNKCVANELQFTDLSPVSVDSWAWDFGDGQSSALQNPTHQYTLAGTYPVILTIHSGASVFTSNSADVVVFSNPVADFSDSLLFYSSFSRVFKDSSTTEYSISNYAWSFDDGSSLMGLTTDRVAHKFSSAGDYHVQLTITDEHGCTDSIVHVITIQDMFSAPNVFTPNSDNINDQFIVTTNGQNKFSVDIYNRWGNLVFRRKSVQQIIWDGRLPDGSLVKPGTYFYVITVDDSDVKYEPETGFVAVFY